MSNHILTLALIIIIIILIILGLIFYTARYSLQKNIKRTEEKLNSVINNSLENDFKNIKKLKLNGESLKQFKDYSKKYNVIFDVEINSIKDALSKAKKFAHNYKIISANNLQKRNLSQIESINKRLQVLKIELSDFEKLNEKHTKNIREFNKEFKQYNKKILNENYLYGDSAAKIEDNLGKLEKEINQFTKLVHSGDHSSAEKMLGTVDNHFKQIKHLMENIPNLYKSLNKTFPSQLSEIKAGHKKMIEESYRFSDDNFEVLISKLEAKVSESLRLLKDLEIGKVVSYNNAISDHIDYMYEEMEKEILAKKKVIKNMKIVHDFIFHAQKQNNALMAELERLSKNYTLEHDEIKNAKSFANAINEIYSIYKTDYQLFKSGEAVYSEILSNQQEAKTNLSKIEKEQRDINDSVADLNDEEIKARESVQQFELNLLNMQREIDRLNLPGVSKDYLEKYDALYKRVKDLSRDINQDKISMDFINKKLSLVSEDMQELLHITQSIVDNAALSERLMQYSNHYKNDNENVSLACEKAKNYFDNTYEYDKSLETIATALEKVEPGLLKRVQSEYNREKNN
ncbi:septation ring formation regulator EzrA [Apilactobacillus ozensis DSM 23829 = JCM 17196]|uniref:Septation ring formation regulator EzrA n=2 Tax=Apilactobacillus ozensis TaxID=866801 RepID=A0A0R2AY55_9LACO|nr:septation ring formation regulator EzrA [Apilactobacillus ozensis]KRM67788.1 septation ring formation regulator EzrA [Apilactobacillus ozensis DSM 23829 = JCM 17196]